MVKHLKNSAMTAIIATPIYVALMWQFGDPPGLASGVVFFTVMLVLGAIADRLFSKS
jgi:hypothetical protein